MDKRQQVLDAVQQIQEEFLEEVLHSLQSYVAVSEVERAKARAQILNGIKRRPKITKPSGKRTWKREDLYE